MKQERVQITYEPLSSLARWPRNPKLHSIDGIQDSIERFGFIQPLTVDETTKQLVAGHGRLESLQKLKAAGKPPPARIEVAKDGEWLVPVLRGVSFATTQEAEAFLLADNRLSELGGWNEEALGAILSDLKSSNDLLGTGWDPMEVDALLKTIHLGLTPEEKLGTTPAEYLERYNAADTKQVVLYFSGDEYAALLPQLEGIMSDHKLVSHTQVFKVLLKVYLEHHTLPA